MGFSRRWFTLHQVRSSSHGGVPGWNYCPLNKGRGQNPGYTCAGGLAPNRSVHAQRRPGPKPRLHRVSRGAGESSHSRSTKAGAKTLATQLILRCVGWVLAVRSTKAGAKTPATLANNPEALAWVDNAQRRPGPKPRLHLGDVGGLPRIQPRSTKAGAKTPATLARFSLVMATLFPLNEGRGQNPGYTCSVDVTRTDAGPAQRRPGPKPRLHLRRGRQQD